jgi:hypothetical protein
MTLIEWLKRPFQMWRESGVKLRLLDAEIEERIADLAAPIKQGGSDTQIAASIQSLNEVTETLKMEWPTVRRVAK